MAELFTLPVLMGMAFSGIRLATPYLYAALGETFAQRSGVLNLGVDVPFHVYFGTGGGPVFPLLVGGGLEYFIDRNLQVNFNVRMGPSIYPNAGRRGRSDAYFTLEALMGVGWRF